MTAPLAVPYGPNTPAIRRFLVRFAALGLEQRRGILALYRERVDTPAWRRAEAALGETMEASGRSDIPDALAGPLLQLVGTSTDEVNEQDDSIDPIAEPALAALLALAVSDLLPPGVLTTLYEPFADAIPRD